MYRKFLACIISIIMILTNTVFAESTAPAPNEAALISATKEMLKIVPVVKENEILNLAKYYYGMSNPKIELDCKSEYLRIVNWVPDFSGKRIDSKKALQMSSNVALAVSYTNAKNFYLAMSSATFALDPKNVVAAENFASAVASYYDDLILEGKKEINMGKYYEDAIKIYNYGLRLAIKDGKLSKQALSALVSLGNIYLDTNKKDKAVSCFKNALTMDKGYWQARKSLYNYYLSERKIDEALKLMLDSNEYPIMVKATSKVSKAKDEEEKKNPTPVGTVPDPVMEKYLDGLSAVNPVSQADFIGEIDREAQSKLQSLIKGVQVKMKYTAPDTKLLTQYSSLRTICTPQGQSDLLAFSVAVEGYRQKSYYMDERTARDVMGSFGYTTDLGGFNSLTELDAAIARDPDFSLNINSEMGDAEEFESYAAEIEKKAEEYRKDPNKASELFGLLSKSQPEKAIMAINPFDYCNPLDIYIQWLNIADFEKKYMAYSSYLTLKTLKNQQMVIAALAQAEEKKLEMEDIILERIIELSPKGDSDESGEEYKWKVHSEIHLGMEPNLNKYNSTQWNQITQLALDNYNKGIKKYVEQMYNDCMKNVILISDKNIQERLEDRVIALALRNITMSLEDVREAFRFNSTGYVELVECGCDEEATKAALEAKRKLEEKLANEQIGKNIAAKKKFESGELDENSEYYKKIIRPYEVHINTPFVTGVVGPYKSGFKINIGHDDVGSIDFSKMQQHIRNTTTYDGGVECKIFSKEAGGFGASVSVTGRVSATSGPTKPISFSDIDISLGAKADLSAPGLVSGTGGFSLSSGRGSKLYGNVGFSGDSLLDNDLKTALGNWKPNLTLNVWEGEYTPFKK